MFGHKVGSITERRALKVYYYCEQETNNTVAVLLPLQEHYYCVGHKGELYSCVGRYYHLLGTNIGG